MEMGIQEVDRISMVPEPIMHHIMSFLSIEEHVLMSMLSKNWKQLCHTLPFIEWYGYYCSDSRKKRIMKYLEQTLLKRHVDMIRIHKLTIEGISCWYPESASFLDRCLCYAIGSNVKELKFKVEGWYNLPQIIFSAKSIEVLVLCGCKLYPPRISVRLFLRKLCLIRVYAADHVIESLIADCPLIELKIVACKGFKSLELFNLTKLNKIKVKDNHDGELEQVDIQALNVHSVTIRGENISVINLASCKNLKRLKLENLPAGDEWFYKEISEFPLLEYFSLYNCKNLRRIRISGPCLKELFITSYFLVELKINAPNLSIFRYDGRIISFASNAFTLSEADLLLCCFNDTQQGVKYIELLANFRQVSKVIKLRSMMGETAIIPTELRQIIHPPLSGIKHLNLEMDELYTMCYPRHVDGLLWISPHIENVSVTFNYGEWHKFSFQFSYKKGETPSCCQTCPVSCWQNCIEKVEIEDTITSEEELIGVNRYCIGGSDIFEKLEGLCRELEDKWDYEWHGDSEERPDNSDGTS